MKVVPIRVLTPTRITVDIGIDVDSVKRKLLSILNPRKTDEELINNSDMSGPFLIAVVLGMLLLMVCS